MSTLRHPVGPQPKRVYWRRRLVVLFVLVAIVAIVVLIVVRPGSGDAATAPAATPSGSAAASDTSGTSGTDATPAPGSVEGAADGSTTVEGGPCDPADVSVVPVTDATNYTAGAIPQISFTITNTGTVACTVNAGTSQQVYTITSGDEVYWTSTDCQTDPTDTEALLAPGVPVASTPFAWDRTRSSPDTCSATDPPQVPAAGASYHLAVSVAGIPSATTQQFILN
ncbi:hypothetical protein N1031_17520 [Herbiconiux moechotypicola]|uniref:DUF4232 domain-containing protein n=1 Tax=Herbiconiux moechotypicola TaxID=637393 RepID=A0ABN3E353_9MICO|nr:hypothetical protein [Herbiconiux moechotypicola]MCS5731563.1 hypothetical protein [Herbiconiux moechotypicola]